MSNRNNKLSLKFFFEKKKNGETFSGADAQAEMANLQQSPISCPDAALPCDWLDEKMI